MNMYRILLLIATYILTVAQPASAFIADEDALWVMRFVSLSHDLPQRNYNVVSLVPKSSSETLSTQHFNISEINKDETEGGKAYFSEMAYDQTTPLPENTSIFMLAKGFDDETKKSILHKSLKQSAIIISSEEKDAIQGYALIATNSQNRSKVLLNTDIVEKLNLSFNKYLEFLVKKVVTHEK